MMTDQSITESYCSLDTDTESSDTEVTEPHNSVSQVSHKAEHFEYSQSSLFTDPTKDQARRWDGDVRTITVTDPRSLMANMGWTDGKGLGSQEQGNTEPVSHMLNNQQSPTDKSGLGHHKTGSQVKSEPWSQHDKSTWITWVSSESQTTPSTDSTVLYTGQHDSRTGTPSKTDQPQVMVTEGTVKPLNKDRTVRVHFSPTTKRLSTHDKSPSQNGSQPQIIQVAPGRE